MIDKSPKKEDCVN